MNRSNVNKKRVLKLAHSTPLGNLKSILTNGLIPGHSDNFSQCFESYYHKTGVYFIPANSFDSNSAADRLSICSNILEDVHSGMVDVDVIDVVILVELETTKHDILKKLVPDEESVSPDAVLPTSGVAEYIYGDSVVWLDSISPDSIIKVYLYDDDSVREYVNTHMAEFGGIMEFLEV